MRPWRFGIDVIAAERRDTAPVIDTRVRERVRFRAAKDSAAACTFIVGPSTSRATAIARAISKGLRLRRVFHRDTGLGAKILNDHFLNMAVAFMAGANCEQALRALGRSIANRQSRCRW